MGLSSIWSTWHWEDKHEGLFKSEADFYICRKGDRMSYTIFCMYALHAITAASDSRFLILENCTIVGVYVLLRDYGSIYGSRNSIQNHQGMNVHQL